MTHLAKSHLAFCGPIARAAAFVTGVGRCLAGAALAVAVGCSSSSSSAADLGPGSTADLTPGSTADLAAYSYTAATINQIDNDSGNGTYGNGKHVVLDRVVAVTKVDKYVNSTNQQCRYEMWVQDATCTTPPCGLVIKAIGPMAPSATSTGKDCPSASTSGTALATISRGDNLRIHGYLVFETDSTPPMSVVEHQLFIDSIEVLDAAQKITPLVITDSAKFGLFVTDVGTLWQTYEGMSLTLQPATGLLQVSAFSSHGFQTTPGNTDWGDTFDSDYYPAGATTYPVVGSTFHAISGVVATRHGGALLPGRNKDFVP